MSILPQFQRLILKCDMKFMYGIEVKGGIKIKTNQNCNNDSVVKSPKATGNVFIQNLAEY